MIISGDPGVGKTTLADHLCLGYIAEGFTFAKISNEIHEAESIFDADTKQVFYFDDFLGRNYLEALSGHEGNQITLFIRRVSNNKNKRFILTSRSTILNQGKILIDTFEHNNLNKNEFELRISSLSDLDKAKILYNHIWHSKLDKNYIDQLYINRRYRNIISHRNFNPRLISYITDSSRLEECPPEQYWKYTQESLTNPGQIWENPFVAQTDDFGKAIILLVVLNGGPIEEVDLSEAYQRFLTSSESANLQGRRDFLTNLKLLTGSFLNRSIKEDGVSVDLFNPSIGDYILARYSQDIATLRKAICCLRTEASILTLLSINEEYIKETQFVSICQYIAKHILLNEIDEYNPYYIAKFCLTYIEYVDHLKNVSILIKKAVPFIINYEDDIKKADAFEVIEWAVDNKISSPEEALSFVHKHTKKIESEDVICAATTLLKIIPSSTNSYTQTENKLNSHVLKLVKNDFSSFIDTDNIFDDLEYEDYESATRDLKKVLVDKLYPSNEAPSLGS